MKNKEKILSLTRESIKNIFNGLFVAEVISAIFINAWVSSYLSNLLSKSSLNHSTYYVIGPLSSLVAILFALTLILFIEWKNRSRLSGAYSIFVLLVAVNASSNWLKPISHGILKATLGWITIFSTLPYIVLFIATAQIIKILKDEHVSYGFLTIGYINLLATIAISYLITVPAAVSNPIFLAIEIVLFFFFAYIPYFATDNKYFIGLIKAFSYSIRTFIFTIIISTVFAIFYLLPITAQFKWPGIYIQKMFKAYIFASFFIITTIKAKHQ